MGLMDLALTSWMGHILVGWVLAGYLASPSIGMVINTMK